MENQPLAKSQPKGLTSVLAAKYSMDPAKFAAVVKSTCMPANATDEEFMAFCMVAQEYNLNPLVRHIFAFPKKGGGIQPIVSVDGWIKITQDNKDFDGMEFEPIMEEGGKVAAITCKIYRKSQRMPTCITEYMSECRRNTEPWNQMPLRMLRHKALKECARVAFGYSGIMDEDEGETIKRVEGREVNEATVSRTEQVKQKILAHSHSEEIKHQRIPTHIDGLPQAQQEAIIEPKEEEIDGPVEAGGMDDLTPPESTKDMWGGDVKGKRGKKASAADAIKGA